MMSKKVVFVLLSFCTLLVVACSHNSHPIGKPLPQLNFDHLNPYNIHGGIVRIQQSYTPSAESKILANDFPVAPEVLLRRYAMRRFVAQKGGASERLIFDIKDASLSEIEDTEDLVSLIAGIGAHHYTLNMLIAMTPVRADGHRAAPFTVKLKRHISIAHNESLAVSEFRKFEMLERAITEIDKSITEIVKNKMTANYF